jgi:hypothetical protein
MNPVEKGSEKKSKFFALILFQHRLWGYIIVPYTLQNEINKGYFRLSECLSPFPNIDTLGGLTSEERDLVKIINEYKDRTLFKLFSKDKSVKEFLEKVTPERREDFIRPYIERRLYKCFTIARDENIPIYFQKKKSSTLHPEDRLFISEDNAEPIFRFARNEEHSEYNLSLESSGKTIDLRKDSFDILCMSPCIVRDELKIIFVSDIEGSKLKPFLTRESILIPKKSELKYFSGFVLNTINNFKVTNSGFEIKEITPVRKAILILETGLKGSTGLTLQFDYQGNKIYSNESSDSFTLFEKKGENFTFNKFERDYDWEKKCRKTLEDFGFYSEDEINFFPGSINTKRKDELYSTLEIINRNHTEIIESGFVLSSRLDLNYNLRPVDIEIMNDGSMLVSDDYAGAIYRITYTK